MVTSQGYSQAYNEEKQGSIERPDFAVILDSIQKEVSVSTDLANRLSNVSNGLKRMESVPEEIANEKGKEPVCLIDFLWVEIRKMGRVNVQLERAVIHLQKVIGS